MLLSAITERQLSPDLTCLDIANAWATASISLLGAQVLSFVPRHDPRERLFVSDEACLDGSKPIRGGIPVCWPWFGAHAEGSRYPAHGYVRSRPWRLLETTDESDCTRLLLQADSEGPGFSGQAELLLELRVGRELQISLLTRNTGPTACRVTMALHSYFRVGDVRQCRLQGLQGSYSDKTRAWAMFDTPEPYLFSEETDRIHLYPAPRVCIEMPQAQTCLRSQGHDSIVVWNPWQEGTRQFKDLGANAWIDMLCVETALTQGLELAPQQTHVLTQTIE